MFYPGWTENFIVQIKDGQSKHIRCTEHKCNAICNEAVVRNLVSTKHPDIAEHFDRHLLESYIMDNNKVKWCPSVPHCGNAIRVEGDSYCEVECKCGLQFCSSVSIVYRKHTPLVHAKCGSFGARNATTSRKRSTGLLLTRSPAPRVTRTLKRMVAATVLPVYVNINFAGFAAVHAYIMNGEKSMSRKKLSVRSGTFIDTHST